MWRVTHWTVLFPGHCSWPLGPGGCAASVGVKEGPCVCARTLECVCGERSTASEAGLRAAKSHPAPSGHGTLCTSHKASVSLFPHVKFRKGIF